MRESVDELGRGKRTGPRRSRRALPFAVTTLAFTIVPAEAAGQDAAQRPGVVPPSTAYIGESAETEGRALPRWQVDPEAGRTLWFHMPPPPDGRPSFWDEIERAVMQWSEVPGLPLTFRRTESPEGADIRFRWTQRFGANQAGTTDWKTDGEGWLASVVVTLAVEHSDGTPMSDEFLRLVALHELGHVVGLPHSEEPADVMHPGNRSRRLSGRDIRSAQRLYGETASPAEEP